MFVNIYRSFCLLILAALLAACSGNVSSIPTVTATPSIVATATSTPYPAGISYLNPQKYQVEYQAAVHDSGFKVTRLLIYQPKPVEWDAQKDVTIDEVSPAPTHENIDAATGSGIYNWDLTGQPKVGEDLPILIKFTFTAYETHTNISPADVKPYDMASLLYKQYTAPERFIQSNDPEIKAKATKIAAGETNPLLLARRFYDYIIDHSTYTLTGKGLEGAKTMLTTGKGECGDYSSLFIALSRASGIPARAVVGYWAVSGLDQTHVWAEFYLEGYGWVPADATIGQSQPGKRDFYFGNMDNQRVILNKGFNIALVPATSDHFVAPFLQVPLWWYWGSGDSKTIQLDRSSWNVTKIP
jgi:hypothetical protein